MKRILLFFFLLHISNLSFAQQLAVKGGNYIANIQSFTTEDGLSHRRVNDFAQDEKGFMWMGTPYGLNRYDGYQFKTFTQKNANLQGNHMRKVFPVDEHIWIVYDRDISSQIAIDIFDPVLGKAQPLAQFYKEDLPFVVDSITHICMRLNWDRSLWIPTKQHLYEYAQHKIKLVFSVADSLEIEDNWKENEGKNGWVLVRHKTRGISLWYINEQGQVLDKTPFYRDVSKNIFDSRILSTFSDGSVLYSFKQKKKGEKPQQTTYLKKKGAGMKEFLFSTNKKYLHQIYAPTQKELWCSNDLNGFDAFDLKGNWLYYVASDRPISMSMPNLFFDKQGGLWFSLRGKNSLLHISKNKFQRYLYSHKSIGRLGSRGLAVDQNGRLYINSHKGTFYIEKGETEPHALPHSPSFYKNVHLDTAFRSALLVDDDNSVWISDQFHRLMHYFPEEGRIENHSYEEEMGTAVVYKRAATLRNWCLYKNKKGRIWIGQNAGLSYYDVGSPYIKKKVDYQGFDELANSEIYYIHSNEKEYWLATSTGLYRANKSMEIQARYFKEGDAEHYLPSNIIAHILEDADGTLWLASKGEGLIQFDPQSAVFKQYTQENGLSHDVLYGIYADAFNNFWISSDMGLMCLDRATFNVKNYLRREGLTHSEFNTASYYKTTDGRIYFGTVDGVTAFHPEDFQKEEPVYSDEIHISSFIKFYNQNSSNKEGSIDNKEVDITMGVTELDHLPIFPYDRTAVLHFSVLDFKNTKNIIYAYKIKGFYSDWHYTKDPKLHLIGLPYGDYRLVVKVEGKGIKPLEIDIFSHPPFYFRLSFILMIILLVCFILYLYIKRRERNFEKQRVKLEKTVLTRTQQIQKQAEDLKALDKLKSRFFANISHELKTPLTLILGPLSFLLKKQQKDSDTIHLETIERNGKHLLQLVEEILDLSKMDANKLEINEKSTALFSFVKRVFSAYESQAHFQEIEYLLNYQMNESWHVLLDQDKCEKILNNFMSNALKFTGAKQTIEMRVYEAGNKLHFAIKDTGKGIHPDDLPHVFERFFQTKQHTIAEGGTGIGLAFCQELTELMGGKLTVESTLGTGSTFMFEIDLKLVKTEAPTVFVEHTEEVVLEEVPVVESELPQKEGTYTVMLVEDNQDMQNYIQSLLVESYQIITCNNGQIAWDYLNDAENKLPNLIISDVMMPQMDGFTLLKHCKNSERIQSIPMIMLTARSTIQDKLNALTIGVDDYLTKPFLVEELTVRVKNLLQNAAARFIPTKDIDLPQAEEVEVAEVIEESEQISENNQVWIKELEALALVSIDDSEFDAETLAKSVGMSRRNLQRRLKKVTGLTPGQYIKEIRLQASRGLLERGVYQTIAEVAYASGFTTPYYFSQIYEKRFGKKASSYFT